jgi:signal transduction histidine kinase
MSVSLDGAVSATPASHGRSRRRTLYWVVALLAAVTALALSAAVILYVGRRAAGYPVSLGEALIGGAADWLLWLVLAPPVIWLARRFPIGPTPWLRNVAVHLVAGAIVALVDVAAFTWIYRATGVAYYEEPTFWQGYARALSLWLHWGLLVYWLIVAGVHALAYYHTSRQRAMQAVRLQSQLTQARLRALRMQLHPHFLFNTLNTIATYVREQRRDAAVDLIADLADLLRASLDEGAAQEVPLHREISFIRRYLEIEERRFGNRLEVRFRVPDALLDAHVPTMILQPLVENAVRHGVGDRVRDGVIRILAERQTGTLVLQVQDNGPGFPTVPFVPTGSHVGLRNTSERLERLYGDDGRLEVRNHPDGGAVVMVSVPWHVEPMEVHPG